MLSRVFESSVQDPEPLLDRAKKNKTDWLESQIQILKAKARDFKHSILNLSGNLTTAASEQACNSFDEEVNSV